jgi:hypothetical protein
MKVNLDTGKDAEKLAKIIVYSKIYFNTVAYGTFHKRKYDLNSFKKYLNATHNPLLAGYVKPDLTDRGANFKKDRKVSNISNRRVDDIKETWIDVEDKDVFGVLKAMFEPLFTYLKLKDDFTPIAAPRSNPRPQSARAPAKAAAAAPARPASAGGKKGGSKSAIQKNQKNNPVKPKANKAGGSKKKK